MLRLFVSKQFSHTFDRGVGRLMVSMLSFYTDNTSLYNVEVNL